ncbi:MAG TPA: VWA domain-containing protein [Terriglobales bacterium]|nr:VWA domain-containing protein [Terriglobales bacterium]
MNSASGQPSLAQNARAACVVMLILTTVTAAQEPTFRAQSNVVTVPVLVRDEQGKPVYGLEARDFIVKDDGVAQAVQMDEAAESEPVSMVVALQSGRRAGREFSRMQGLAAMLSPIFALPGSRVALVEFDSTPNVTQPFSHDSVGIDQALQHLEPGDGGAAILDAVQLSVRLLEESPKEHRRVLLLISETRDHGSHTAKIEDVVAAVGNSNVIVYALPFSPSLSQVLDTERGSNRDEGRTSGDLLSPLLMASQAMRRNTARTIADMTGGEYELFSSRKNFERRMTDFANHLHSRYLLSFEPKDPHPGLHAIRVELRSPQKRSVLARNSYWAEGTR